MTKNYIILYDGNNMIFPVKQKYDPYIQAGQDKDVKTFCGGCPQFFGGAGADDETILTTLRREVAEESVLTYTLKNGLVTLFDEGTYEDQYGDDVPCEFFCTKAGLATGIKWPASSDIWDLLAPEYREMCWVSTVPQTTFQNMGNNATDYDIAALIIGAMSNGAPSWAANQMVTYPVDQFMSSLTSEAFPIFVRAWVAGKLP